MGLLIRGGDVVTAAERRRADVYCAGQTITRIEAEIAIESVPPDTECIDAAGKLVFPGFIDPHTHIYLPLGEVETRDSYESASAAALVGGTTCFFDFVSPAPLQSPLEALAVWQKRSAGRSYCDYAFHLAISQLDAVAEGELRRAVAEGHRSFKVYLAYPGVGVDDATLVRVLRLGRELGVVTCAHCENEALVEALRGMLVAAGNTGAAWHAASRPPAVEADGTHHMLTFAELLDAEVYLVHVSCSEALALAAAARQRGVRLHVETLIQFLMLDAEVYQRPDFEAAKYVVSPPIRDATHREALWLALAEGLVDTVATDHAPFNWRGDKERGRHDFRQIPNGMPGIEDRISLLYSYGVATGKIDLERMVALASTTPARIFGLYPRKGTIAVGSDADLVVFDPAYRGAIQQARQRMKVDYNGFEGLPICGRAESVSVRGELMVRDGMLIGPLGWGQLLVRPQATPGGE